MKKRIFVFSLLIITGCTSLNKQQSGKDKEIMQSISKSEISEKKLVQNSINLGNGGTKIVLEDIQSNWEKNILRTPNNVSTLNTTELYIGESLIIKDPEILSVAIVDEKVPNYQLARKDDYYVFRSVFQYEFPIKIMKKNGSVQNLVVKNILKYKVTKDAAYENIRTTYNNKKYQDSISAIDLYNIAFPKDIKENELNILLFNIYIETMDYEGAYRKLVNLKKIENYTESEITSLFSGELKLTTYSLTVDDYYINYAKKYSGFSKEIVKYLKNKTMLTDKEYGYLMYESEKNNDQELKNIINEKKSTIPPEILSDSQGNEILYQSQTSKVEEPIKVENSTTAISDSDKKYYDKGKNAYELSRYDEAIVYLNNIKDKNINGDIYYLLGSSYFLVENYENAVSNYKNYVNSGEEGISKAEATHNIAFSYEKLGDFNSATSWYKKVVENFPGTTWARKSNIALIRLRNKVSK